MKPTFAQRVRTTRKVRGLSQPQLADRCKCSKQLISSIERGETDEVKMGLLYALADTLEVSPRWLATGTGTQYHTGTLSDAERNIILTLRQLPPAVREQVVHLAETLAVSGSAAPSPVAPFGAISPPVKR